MATNKRFITWSAEELNVWMVMESTKVKFMASTNSGIAYLKEEFVQRGKFISVRKGVSLKIGNKTMKLGYTKLMKEKLSTLFGDERHISCHQPFAMVGTNRAKATMCSYWSCDHRNAFYIRCPWEKFRVGSKLQFDVGPHDCKLCDILADQHNIDINESEELNDTHQPINATDHQVTSSTAILTEDSTEKSKELSVSQKMSRDLYLDIKKTVNEVIDGWHKEMTTSGRDFDAIIFSAPILGFNVNQAVMKCSTNIRKPNLTATTSLKIANDDLGTKEPDHGIEQQLTDMETDNEENKKQKPIREKSTTTDYENLPEVLKTVVDNILTPDKSVNSHNAKEKKTGKAKKSMKRLSEKKPMITRKIAKQLCSSK